ncbi:hypothetical protein [Gracilibacillus timonensis]|uniref:hypothetical protein n=1 Tax=Gracilibacillus timonensis TaxID=1816696 RepID=UPI0008263DFC|nr:hypothetical protein [Gracilibacillus timonensis]
MDSLVESDATSQQVLSTLQEITIDNESEPSFVFTPLQLFSSMASTEQAHFQEMLFQISSLYGIDLLRFYTGEQVGIMFGQAGEIESMKVEAKENRGDYLFPTDNGTYQYIAGVSGGKDIHDKNG